MKINLYDVDREYTEYLQHSEIEERGFTTVPNMDYPDSGRYQKFFCGPLFKINGIDYYVGASHKPNLNKDVHPVYFDDEPGVIKGTLRFQYMIPVAESTSHFININNEPKPSREIFLYKYQNSLDDAHLRIYDKALDVYIRQVNGKVPEHLEERFNNFKFLESKMIQYEINYRLGTLYEKDETKVHYDDEKDCHFVDYGEYRRYLDMEDIKDFDELAITVFDDWCDLSEARDHDDMTIDPELADIDLMY